MTMDRQAIFAAFIRDMRQTPDALARYCIAQPALKTDLLALAHELVLQSSLSDDTPIDPSIAQAIDAALTANGATRDPFSHLDVADYASLRQDLDVPSIVLNAFRDRLVAAGSVPLALLDRIAAGLGVGTIDLATFLAGPPKLAGAAQYKADGLPQASAAKVSFASLLDEAGVSGDRAAALLSEED